MSEDRPLTSVRYLSGIPHYYGDEIRLLFVASVVLSFIVMPLWGNLLPFGTFLQIAGAIGFVILAGLTNPHSKLLIIVDTIVAAVGVLLLEYSAIQFYRIDSMFLFWAREVAAILLLFALYAGVRTVRSMLIGNLGHAPRPWEFDKPSPGDHQSPIE